MNDLRGLGCFSSLDLAHPLFATVSQPKKSIFKNIIFFKLTYFQWMNSFGSGILSFSWFE